jgi:hypothetical protein
MASSTASPNVRPGPGDSRVPSRGRRAGCAASLRGLRAPAWRLCRTATRATHVDAASSDSTSGRHDARGEAGRREAGRGGRPAPRVVVRDATGAILAAVSAWPGMVVKQETGAATTKRVDRDARHAGMGSSRPSLRREQTTADARPHLDGRELMGMHGTRRAWTRPALVAIVRRTLQEDVLTGCTYFHWAGRPQNAALSCTVVTCVASCDALGGFVAPAPRRLSPGREPADGTAKGRDPSRERRFALKAGCGSLTARRGQDHPQRETGRCPPHSCLL